MGNSLEFRFWMYTKVQKGCWIWLGSKTVRGGYGQLNHKGVLIKAHRYSYELHFGKPAKHLFVCHRCNNPACVRPTHLYAGTPKQNWEDTIRTHGLRLPGNAPFGQNHHDAKLTEKAVKIIRQSNETGRSLSKRFKVSPSIISKVKRGELWKHVMIL